MRFEWNMDKDAENKKIHKVSFQEACSVFTDSHMLSKFDKDHSDDEDRWITMGDTGDKLLVVIHTFRTTNDVESVRIISARGATTEERRQYASRRKKP